MGWRGKQAPWGKLASGLYVPPYLKFATRRRCCCEACDDCECEHCNNSKGACCYKVTITGMANNTCGASDCEALDRDYYLKYDSACTWNCDVSSACDPTEISLVVSESGGNYYLTVTLGSHEWEKNYSTTKPTCLSLSSESIPHKTNSGDCDSSSATCVVTRVCTEYCPCYDCACTECDGTGDNIACCLRLTWSGVTGDGFCKCYSFPRTVHGSGCTRSSNYTDPVALVHANDSWCNDDATAQVVLDGGTYYLRVEHDGTTWEKDLGASKPDCHNFSDTLDYVGGAGASECDCGVVDSTVLVQSINTAACVANYGCTFCMCGDMPGRSPGHMVLKIEGLESHGASEWWCGDCSPFNDTWVLPRAVWSPADWRYIPAPADSDSCLWALRIVENPVSPCVWATVWVRITAGTLEAGIGTTTALADTGVVWRDTTADFGADLGAGAGRWDCTNFNERILPYAKRQHEYQSCDATNSTATVWSAI